MKKLYFFFFLIVLSAGGASAQHTVPSSLDTMAWFGNDTLFYVHQESIPPNDSGGRWIKTTILLTSCSSWPVHVSGFQLENPYPGGCHWAPEFFFKPDDSAWFLADSLMLILGSYNAASPVAFGSPWKYKDSLPPPPSSSQYYQYPLLQFVIPPHGTLRIPYWFKAIGPFSFASHDTVNVGYMFFQTQYPWRGALDWFSDSIVGTKVLRRIPERVYSTGPPLYAIAPYSAPYTIPFKGTWTNKNSPVVLDWGSFWNFGFQDTIMVFQRTRTSFKIVGEYADRFIPPSDTLFWPTCQTGNFAEIGITFMGAPKSVVHDTLVSSFTDGWGTIVTRNPIEAYTISRDAYQIRQLSPNLKAPFLGRAQGNAAIVINTSNFPITVRNLQVVSYYDSMDFEVSAPAMIAAHDSGYISVTLRDRNLYLDTNGTSRSATITGIIAPYQQELAFQDSTFSFSVSGSIDVYSPLYFSSIPLLKHGVHPAGIIFTSSVSSLSGPGTFLTIYGNNDPTTEYFGMPYYDDPHFTFAIGDYIGFGTVTLPGNVMPDTGFLGAGIQVLTTFTGDSYHNYFTQMHWPRATDTVTIDVVCIGKNAPHLSGVPYASEPRSVFLWPNPASSILHIRSGDPTANFWITDILGRKIRTGKGTESSIDISDLPAGLYAVSFSKLGESIKFQVLR